MGRQSSRHPVGAVSRDLFGSRETPKSLLYEGIDVKWAFPGTRYMKPWLYQSILLHF